MARQVQGIRVIPNAGQEQGKSVPEEAAARHIPSKYSYEQYSRGKYLTTFYNNNLSRIFNLFDFRVLNG